MGVADRGFSDRNRRCQIKVFGTSALLAFAFFKSSWDSKGQSPLAALCGARNSPIVQKREKRGLGGEKTRVFSPPLQNNMYRSCTD